MHADSQTLAVIRSRCTIADCSEFSANLLSAVDTVIAFDSLETSRVLATESRSSSADRRDRKHVRGRVTLSNTICYKFDVAKQSTAWHIVCLAIETNREILYRAVATGINRASAVGRDAETFVLRVAQFLNASECWSAVENFGIWVGINRASSGSARRIESLVLSPEEGTRGKKIDSPKKWHTQSW